MISIYAPTINLATVGKKWAWFVLWGIALLILGAAAISAATFTTLLTVVFLGTILLLAGAVIAFDTFVFWTGKWSSFFLHSIIALLYLGVGYLMITTPVLTSESLTLLLGFFYLLAGASRIVSSIASKLPRWKWALFNGIVALLLGILILTNWPASSLFIIGLFVGIDIFFCGLAFIMLGFTAKTLNP